jgi:hypothetical protein
MDEVPSQGPEPAFNPILANGIFDLYRNKLPHYQLQRVVQTAQGLGIRTIFCTGYPVDDADLSDFAGLTRATVFGLMQTKVTGIGLPELRRMKELEVLDLSLSPLTGEGLDALVEIKTLRVLRVSCGTLPVEALSQLKDSSITELEADGLPVTDAELESLLQHRNLSSLSVSGKHLTGEVIRILRASKRETKLRVVNSEALAAQIPYEDRINEHFSLTMV